MNKNLEPWRRAWRTLAPHLSTDGLESLAAAIRSDDLRLIQGAYYRTLFAERIADDTIAGGCPLCWAYWQGLPGLRPAGFEEFLARLRGKTLGTDAIGVFVKWYDDGDRAACLAELLPEIDAVLAARYQEAAV